MTHPQHGGLHPGRPAQTTPARRVFPTTPPSGAEKGEGGSKGQRSRPRRALLPSASALPRSPRAQSAIASSSDPAVCHRSPTASSDVAQSPEGAPGPTPSASGPHFRPRSSQQRLSGENWEDMTFLPSFDLGMGLGFALGTPGWFVFLEATMVRTDTAAAIPA